MSILFSQSESKAFLIESSIWRGWQVADGIKRRQITSFPDATSSCHQGIDFTHAHVQWAWALPIGNTRSLLLLWSHSWGGTVSARRGWILPPPTPRVCQVARTHWVVANCGIDAVSDCGTLSPLSRAANMHLSRWQLQAMRKRQRDVCKRLEKTWDLVALLVHQLP